MKTIRGTFALAMLLAAAGCVHGAADRSTDPSSSRAADPVSVAMISAYDAGPNTASTDASPMAAMDGGSTLAWDGGASAALVSGDGGAGAATDAGFALMEAGHMDATFPQKGASAVLSERGAKTLGGSAKTDAGARTGDAGL